MFQSAEAIERGRGPLSERLPTTMSESTRLIRLSLMAISPEQLPAEAPWVEYIAGLDRISSDFGHALFMLPQLGPQTAGLCHLWEFAEQVGQLLLSRSPLLQTLRRRRLFYFYSLVKHSAVRVRLRWGAVVATNTEGKSVFQDQIQEQ